MGSPELLPEPLTRPVDPAEVLGRLRGRRRAVTEQALEGRPVYLHLRSGTFADVGGWLGPRPIDLFALEASLLLISAGRFEFEGQRPLVAEPSCTDLAESTYNYTTGRLALAPAEHCPVKGVKVSPADAQQVLAQIHHALKER